MRRIPTMLITVVVIMLLTVSLVRAITYGQPDGERHPNVGVFIIEDEGEKVGICSGTLIAPNVYLTAGHCVAFLPSLGIDEGEGEVWVSFDSEFDVEKSKLHSGVYYLHPDYGHDFAHFNDVAVVVLDKRVPGKITPASLPPAGFLDELGPEGLKGQQFTAVGYGVTEPDIGGGPPEFSGFGIRRYSVSTFNALNKNWIHLSQNNATGDSGTCFGDSGGPNFFGAGDEETDVIAALTSTGDAMCLATNEVYRIDTQPILDFLGPFVDN